MGQDIRMIACITSNGAIGLEDDFIIHSSEYTEWLKEEVEDTFIVVGKKTYDLGVLPEEVFQNDYLVVEDEEEIEINTDKDISVLGGESVFEIFIDVANIIYLAEIDGYYVGDRYFPEYDVDDFDVEFVKELEELEAVGILKKYIKKSDLDE